MPSPEDQAALGHIETLIQNANAHGILIHKTTRTTERGARILELRRRGAFSAPQTFAIMEALTRARFDFWIFAEEDWAGISIQLR